MGVDFIRLDAMHEKAREREAGPADSAGLGLTLMRDESKRVKY
jgi:hypothetical protein